MKSIHVSTILTIFFLASSLQVYANKDAGIDTEAAKHNVVAERASSANYIYDQESSYDSRKISSATKDIDQNSIRKLGRGLNNTIFGVCEIPLQIYETDQTTGGLAAWTWGLPKGILRFLEREVIGIVEIVTFPVPLPGASTQKYGDAWGYGPLIEPEWIFSFDSNPYNFIYRNRGSN